MIAKKSTLMVIQSLMGMIFGFITLKYIALEIGTAAYGEMVLGYAVVSLFSFFANLGYGSSHVKRISEGKDLGECIGTFIVIRVATIALMSVAVVVSLAVWTWIYPNGMTDVSIAVILSVLVYFIILNLASIPTLTFDARAETSKTQIASMVQHPMKLAAVVFVIMMAGGVSSGISNDDMAFRLTWAYYTIGMIGSTLIAWGMFVYYKYPVKKPTWKMVKSYTSFALLTSVAGLVSVIILNADDVMLGYYWTSSVVGEYTGVQSLTNMLTIIPWSVAGILLPVMSNLHYKKAKKAIVDLLKVCERHVSLLVAPITFFIFFFSRPIIHLLLSDKWYPADFTLSFLAIVIFITALNTIRNTMLQAIGRPGLTASIGILSVVINLVVNFLFIPDWSWFHPTLTIPGVITPTGVTHIVPLDKHTGAAVALIIGSLVNFVLLRYYSWKCIGGGLYHGVTVKHVAASTVMILPLIYLNRVYTLARWYDLFIYMLIGLGIYVLVLYLIKEFTKDDLKFYLDLLNPKGMGSYISAELKEKDLSVAMETMTGDHGKDTKKPKAPRRRRSEEE